MYFFECLYSSRLRLLKNTYVNFKKHVRVSGKTCTCFFENIDCFYLDTVCLLSKPFSLSFVLSEKIRPNDIRNGRFDGEFSILFYNIKTKCHIFVLVFLL